MCKAMHCLLRDIELGDLLVYQTVEKLMTRSWISYVYCILAYCKVQNHIGREKDDSLHWEVLHVFPPSKITERYRLLKKCVLYLSHAWTVSREVMALCSKTFLNQHYMLPVFFLSFFNHDYLSVSQKSNSCGILLIPSFIVENLTRHLAPLFLHDWLFCYFYSYVVL